MAEAANYSVVPLEELRAFVVRCMEAVGTRTDHSEALAELLVTADHRGHFSHGLNRLDSYMADREAGLCASGDVTPVIVSEKLSVANVDGKDLLGPVVGKFCMDIAIKKARETGVGWVTARASNHFGIAGWYSIQAASQGLLGLAFTNSSPSMVPSRSKDGILGTNPISLSAPAGPDDMFVLDMATTTVALGKVEISGRKGQPIPPGWGVDSSGQETFNPEEVLHGGGLLPLGGLELTGGYKGYGLAMMVEIFTSILSGATCSPNGHCFVAIDPDAFAPGFVDRMSDLMGICRSLEPIDGETEVLVAGDPERKHMAMCKELGGIPYHPNQIKYANEIAEKYRIPPMKTL
ncbi:uncharacterized oxidoreductase YjmC-like isoform X2 [Liolophura sinensis]|uniref:uncharacterized oxidoreductase YjmC-like isoform X2 n=1 Tax=Liolophura sinensis TaxID=3198878 RepID=UPI003158804A